MVRRRTVHVLSILCIGAAVSVSLAQDTQDTRALAGQYLDASGNGDLGAEIRDAVLVKIAAQPGVPPDFVAAFKEVAKPAELRELLITIYAESLDAATLQAGIDFYNSPAGKKIAEAQPVLSDKTRTVSEEWTTACVNTTLESLGLNTAEENMELARRNLEEARRNGNETACLGALKTIGVCQVLFREADKDGNGTLDYAPDMAALLKVNLVDSVLGTGTKQGYTFRVCRGSTAPEFIWMAVASPIEMGVTGDRYFATNHEGVAYYRGDKPFELDTKDCKITGGTVVGR